MFDKKFNVMNAPIKSNERNKLRIFFGAVILFLLVYDTSFVQLGALTTARAAVIFLTIFYLRESIKIFFRFTFNNAAAIFGFFFICIYSLILVLYSDSEDVVIFSRATWFIIYCLFSPFLILPLCKFDLRIFLRTYFLCSIFQSFFVFISMSSLDYREWMQANINIGGNIDIMKSFRSLGLSGAGGATLSLQLALGFISGLILLDDRVEKKSMLDIGYIFLGLFAVFAAEIFVGRTGLLFCIISLLFYLFLVFKFNIGILFVFILTSIFSALGFKYFINSGLFGANYDVDSIFDWSFSVFSRQGDGTLSELLTQFNETPSLDWFDFIFGTGRVLSSTGNNFAGSDSGYIQTFYALGLPISILLYGSVFLLLFSLLRRAVYFNKISGLFLVTACFALELKEPFIHKYSMVQFLVVLFLLTDPFLRGGKKSKSIVNS